MSAAPSLQRARIERAIESSLDHIALLLAYLDTLDGDPDHEDAGDAVPPASALVNDGAQFRWAGFERAAA